MGESIFASSLDSAQARLRSAASKECRVIIDCEGYKVRQSRSRENSTLPLRIRNVNKEIPRAYSYTLWLPSHQLGSVCAHFPIHHRL